MFVFVFFFQAEDGIRDDLVTGVQTCALPISLSDEGVQQADHLARYLGPHLEIQVSKPVHIITSPMRRTLETIRPTIHYLVKQSRHAIHVIVNAFYYESDGCHTKDQPEEGMNQQEITDLLHAHLTTDAERELCEIEFVGFVDPDRGWNCQATGADTRAQPEVRATKF